MFRCPHCGQAEQMNFDNDEHYFINSNSKRTGFDLTETYIAGPDQEPDQWRPVDREDANTHLQHLKEAMPEGVKCVLCKEVSDAEDWFRCWVDPLRYLETENLCHCGGELILDRIPNSYPPMYGYVCEKCTWVKPNAKVSGS